LFWWSTCCFASNANDMVDRMNYVFFIETENRPYVIHLYTYIMHINNNIIIKTYIFISVLMNLLCVEMSGSHGGEYEDGCLLGCCAV
jgi:hypothetical protein